MNPIPALIVLASIACGAMANLMYQATCTPTPEADKYDIHWDRIMGGSSFIETCSSEELIGWALTATIIGIGVIIALVAYGKEDSHE